MGGIIQSTSLPVSLLAGPEKNWLEDGLRSLHSVATRASIVKEFIPLYD
jgi:nicotinamide riboside kinase